MFLAPLIDRSLSGIHSLAAFIHNSSLGEIIKPFFDNTTNHAMWNFCCINHMVFSVVWNKLIPGQNVFVGKILGSARIMLCTGPANEKRRCSVMFSFIGWAHALNGPFSKCHGSLIGWSWTTVSFYHTKNTLSEISQITHKFQYYCCSISSMTIVGRKWYHIWIRFRLIWYLYWCLPKTPWLKYILAYCLR